MASRSPEATAAPRSCRSFDRSSSRCASTRIAWPSLRSCRAVAPPVEPVGPEMRIMDFVIDRRPLKGARAARASYGSMVILPSRRKSFILETRKVPMRYAPEHNEATRERILDEASRLVREHGVAAVGLAKIMAEADLTVGTFYTHFDSKEALLREALLRTLQDRHEALEQALRGGDLEMAVRAYLSPEHRDAPGTGCPVAALASEVGRHPRATRRTFASHVEPTLDALAMWLPSRRAQRLSPADPAASLRPPPAHHHPPPTTPPTPPPP